MDIAQILNVSDASSTAQGGKSTTSGETGFAQLLQQLVSTARLNTDSQALLSNKALPGDQAPLDSQTLLGDALGEGELSIEALLADLESADGPSDTALAALATLMQDANNAATPNAAGAVTPLAQQIAQALEAQASPRQATTALNANMASDSDPFDLAAIRQRLDLIASAQQGDPAQSSPAALGLPGGGDSSTLRHRQLTAQGLQNLASQNSVAQNVDGQFTAQTTSTADILASASGSGSDTAQTARSNDSLQMLALGGNAANAGSPTNGAQPQLAATPAATLTAPLASAQWQQGLGQQLVALHQRGGQRVDLHLHPAELGPLSVSLKVDDQLAQAQFFSANPQVRAAIEQAIPQLREALEENGIQLGEAMVGEHQHDDGHTGSGNEAALAASRSNAETLPTGADEPLLAEQADHLLDNAGNGVDLYA